MMSNFVLFFKFSTITDEISDIPKHTPMSLTPSKVFRTPVVSLFIFKGL